MTPYLFILLLLYLLEQVLKDTWCQATLQKSNTTCSTCQMSLACNIVSMHQ